MLVILFISSTTYARDSQIFSFSSYCFHGLLKFSIPGANHLPFSFFTFASLPWHCLCSICQFSSVQSCPTLCNPMYYSTPGFPVLYHLLEFAQTHVHWVSDAIQPSHPVSSPIPPASNLSEHQSFLMTQLFTSGGQSIGASATASVLPMNIQGWFPLGLTVLISLQPKGLSRIFSNTTVWKNQFFSTQPSLWSNSHIHSWLLENKSFD